MCQQTFSYTSYLYSIHVALDLRYTTATGNRLECGEEMDALILIILVVQNESYEVTACRIQAAAGNCTRNEIVGRYGSVVACSIGAVPVDFD